MLASTSQAPGGHTEMLSEGSAEMGLIIKAPGIGDLADRTLSRAILYQFPIALLKTLNRDPAHQ